MYGGFVVGDNRRTSDSFPDDDPMGGDMRPVYFVDGSHARIHAKFLNVQQEARDNLKSQLAAETKRRQVVEEALRLPMRSKDSFRWCRHCLVWKTKLEVHVWRNPSVAGAESYSCNKCHYQVTISGPSVSDINKIAKAVLGDEPRKEK